MINRFLLPLFLFLCAAAGWAQPSREAIAALLDDDILAVSDASLVVYDLDADSLLFAHLHLWKSVWKLWKATQRAFSRPAAAFCTPALRYACGFCCKRTDFEHFTPITAVFFAYS